MSLGITLSNDRVSGSVASEFYYRCFLVEYGRLLGPDYLTAHIGELASSILADDLEGRIVLSAWLDTRLVGTVVGKLVEDTFYLWGAYVDPDQLRQGIGSVLFNAISAQLPSGTIIEIQVLKSSAAALAFWAATGFQVTGTAMSEVFPGKSLEICFMQSTIGAPASC